MVVAGSATSQLEFLRRAKWRARPNDQRAEAEQRHLSSQLQEKDGRCKPSYRVRWERWSKATKVSISSAVEKSSSCDGCDLVIQREESKLLEPVKSDARGVGHEPFSTRVARIREEPSQDFLLRRKRSVAWLLDHDVSHAVTFHMHAGVGYTIVWPRSSCLVDFTKWGRKRKARSPPKASTTSGSATWAEDCAAELRCLLCWSTMQLLIRTVRL